MSINLTREAIEVFLEIKRKLDQIRDEVIKAKIENKDKERLLKNIVDIESKLRSRSREIPEMMVDLGLVPTLSFCLAKAGIDNLMLVFRLMSGCSTDFDELKNIKPEEFSYALYTYIILRYLSKIITVQLEIEGLEKLSRESKTKEFADKLYEYLNNLARGSIAVATYKLLQPYLIQFKRLCEAAFRLESGRE